MKSSQGLVILITLLFIILFHVLIVFMCKTRGCIYEKSLAGDQGSMAGSMTGSMAAGSNNYFENSEDTDHCPFNEESTEEEDLLEWLQTEGDSIYASVGNLSGTVDNAMCSPVVSTESSSQHPLQKRIDSSVILPEIKHETTQHNNNVISWNNSVSYAPIL